MRGVVRFFGGGLGRLTPPQSGYRPQAAVGDILTSCLIEGDEGQVFTFDTDHPVRFRLILQDLHGLSLAPGTTTGLYEGSRKVGQLTVLAEA
jgi:hypothetical protein